MKTSEYCHVHGLNSADSGITAQRASEHSTESDGNLTDQQARFKQRNWYYERAIGRPYTVPDISYQPGDVLLDWDLWLTGGAELVGEMHTADRITAPNLLALFKFTEALILYERLFFWVGKEPPLLLQENVGSGLIDRDILVGMPFPDDEWYATDETVVDVINYLKSSIKLDKTLSAQVESMSNGGDSPVSRFVEHHIGYQHVTRRLGLDYEAEVMFAPFASLLPSKSNIPLLDEVYRSFSDAILDELRKDKQHLAPVPLFVPPVVLEVLRRAAGSRGNYLREALALRDEFSDFRSKYTAWQRAMTEGAMTGDEMMAMRRDHVADIKRVLDKKKVTPSKTSLVQELFSALFQGSVSESEGEIVVSPRLNLGGLIGLVAEKFTLRRIRGRVRVLFDLFDSIRQMKRVEMAQLLLKTFDIEESELKYQLAQFEKFAERAESLVAVQRDESW